MVSLGVLAIMGTAFLVMSSTRAAFTESTQNSGSSLTEAASFGCTTTDIDVGNFYYSPSTPVTIDVGCDVRWNVVQATHTSTSNTGVWDSGTITIGNSYTYTFTSTGSYLYGCSIHPSKSAQQDREIIVE